MPNGAKIFAIEVLHSLRRFSTISPYVGRSGPILFSPGGPSGVGMSRKFSWVLLVMCVLVGTIASAPVAGAAGGREQADDHIYGDIEFFDTTLDPDLDEEVLLTDSAEANVVLGETCTYQSALTGKPAAPSNPSFVYIYGIPSDVSSQAHMDRPRDCSDGSFRMPSLSRTSRNLAVWHTNQSANLEYRTLKNTYTHAYKGTTYTIRQARRFVSKDSLSTWNGRALLNFSDKTSPRLNAWRDELIAAGWDGLSNVKYVAMLHSRAQSYTGNGCPSGSTCYILGIAYTGGKYSMSVRTVRNPNTDKETTVRYGCASRGDVFSGHEATHQLNVGHPNDHNHDLMKASWGGRTFKSSPAIIWDYNRDHYHSNVRGHSYVIASSFGQTGYSTC